MTTNLHRAYATILRRTLTAEAARAVLRTIQDDDLRAVIECYFDDSGAGTADTEPAPAAPTKVRQPGAAPKRAKPTMDQIATVLSRVRLQPGTTARHIADSEFDGNVPLASAALLKLVKSGEVLKDGRSYTARPAVTRDAEPANGAARAEASHV